MASKLDEVIDHGKPFFFWSVTLLKVTPGEILWHWHASATAYVFTVSPA
jgi:hypothetical protein